VVDEEMVLETADGVRLADALDLAGFDLISYDARGHGGSGGECTLGDDEIHDVAAAVAFARRSHDQVVTVGASMGAIATLRHAAADHDLAGSVIVSCPAQWRLHSPQSALGAVMTRTRPGRWVVGRAMNVRVASTWSNPDPPEELAGRVRRPLAIVHGDADRFIPAGQARRLADRTIAPCRLDVVDDMGHAFHPASVDPITRAIEWVIATS
jgi:pimeloyl-ACP methyl ester carboxylesterase